MPSKKAILSGLAIAAVFMLVYNKVPAVKKALGGM